MLREKLTKELVAAMKAHDKVLSYVLKMIKAEFQKFETSKDFKEENFTELKEIAILQKMEKSWIEELEMFTAAGRDTSELKQQIAVLRTFIPLQVPDEDIKSIIIDSGIEPKPQNMKAIMDAVHAKYPSAENKRIANIVKQLNS